MHDGRPPRRRWRPQVWAVRKRAPERHRRLYRRREAAPTGALSLLDLAPGMTDAERAWADRILGLADETGRHSDRALRHYCSRGR
jgi:hypothetical protein